MKKSNQPTNEVLVNELEIYIRPIKIINLFKQVLTPNHHPCHNLPQACGGSKSVCLVCKWPIENLSSHLITVISNNEQWSGQLQQTNKQSMMLRLKLNHQMKVLQGKPSNENELQDFLKKIISLWLLDY